MVSKYRVYCAVDFRKRRIEDGAGRTELGGRSWEDGAGRTELGGRSWEDGAGRTELGGGSQEMKGVKLDDSTWLSLASLDRARVGVSKVMCELQQLPAR